MKIFKIHYRKDLKNSCKYVGGDSVGEALSRFNKENKNMLSYITDIDTIEVGSGASYGVGSDCYPYTIVGIVNERTVVVQADRYEPDTENGYDYYGNQVYRYYPDQNGERTTVTLRKNGMWLPVGSTISRGGCYAYGYSLGHRRAYRNPSF